MPRWAIWLIVICLLLLFFAPKMLAHLMTQIGTNLGVFLSGVGVA